MRNFRVIMIHLVFFLIVFTSKPVFAADINVEVNGAKVDFPDAKPFINEDSRTMVPIRFITEKLGSKVQWNQDTHTINIQYYNDQIKLSIGSNRAYINGKTIEFDTRAVIKDDRTFVPLRFVAEAHNANVNWIPDRRTVTVQTKARMNGDFRINVPAMPSFEEEKVKINNEVTELKEAFKSKNIEQIVTHFTPDKRDFLNSEFGKMKNILPEFADALNNWELTLLSTEYGWSSFHPRTAQVTVYRNGKEYHLEVVKLDNKWYFVNF
ncbi:hypothetical protein GJ688_12565 [Heliobacillus mobilis]|uniref:Copper amine oxidase-like N-terminal domain-containing protein n=1 Tax=Heliobacterium mobile TaxID=28064 RepID=A0A6I3SM44_HELMO|nr:copper amine oxidase N-terminal domain-containing protein [Heliobacterium mobile]MTV49805.1 hypothetical protein [Heliobacterium mobile]